MLRKQIEQLMAYCWQMGDLHQQIESAKMHPDDVLYQQLQRQLQEAYNRVKALRDELYERVMRGIGETP